MKKSNPKFFSFGFFVYISFIILIKSKIMNHSLRQITAAELKSEMRNRIVRFFFIKKDGSLREVQGTTRLAHIPADKHPQGVRETPPSVIVFWDLLAGDWRSAKIETQFFIKD